MGSVIRSVGVYSPEPPPIGTGTILTNQDLETILDTTDEWITQRTGIKKRRIAGPHENNQTMAAEAAVDAICSANVCSQPIGEVVVATNTNLRKFPNIGMHVVDVLQRREYGIRSGAIGWDVPAGCGGINVALRNVDALIELGWLKRAQVIGADHLSSVTDYSDREVAILFGDGASAYDLIPGVSGYGFVGHCMKGSPDGYEIIRCDEGVEKVTFVEAFAAQREGRKGKDVKKTIGSSIKMDGRAVYKYVVREIKELIKGFKDNEALNPHGIDFSELKGVGPHLANLRMLDSVNDRYPGFLDKCWIDPDYFCNTSTASQGRGVKRFLEEGAEPGEYYLMMGFGAGLIFAANLYRVPPREFLMVA